MVHPADELGPGLIRADDAPGREHAEQARDPDLAAVSVDSDLGELGTEGVPGVVGQRVDIRRDGSLRGEPARRHGPVAGSDLLTQRPAGLHHRPTPRRGAHRAAGDHRGRQYAVADTQVDSRLRHAESLGRDRQQGGPRTGPDVHRRDRYLVPVRAGDPHPCL